MQGLRMLSNLFKKKSTRWEPSGPTGARAYAIGDVHGRLDLMEALLAQIEDDNRLRGEAKTWIIFLGDLVDRGPDSCGVINRLLNRPVPNAQSVYIKGNHEEFFLVALSGDATIIPQWLTYGGRECVESYGISNGWMLNAKPGEIVERLASQVPASHVRFLEGMADTFKFGDYLFVHAGIRPGVELQNQVSRDLRWIREGFLDDRADHGIMVVHGHTIVEDVEQHPNRIAIDTGAYRSGTLTALGLEGSERWILQARD
jgi:serine/threonine protein phosphatase 1